METAERVMAWAVLAVLASAMGAFLWQMCELFIATNAMFDALEAALEGRYVAE